MQNIIIKMLYHIFWYLFKKGDQNQNNVIQFKSLKFGTFRRLKCNLIGNCKKKKTVSTLFTNHTSHTRPFESFYRTCYIPTRC